MAVFQELEDRLPWVWLHHRPKSSFKPRVPRACWMARKLLIAE
jgi:hypothetical protein